MGKITAALLFTGSLLLAFEPALWLFSTWYEPGYERVGLVVFGAVVMLFLWSLSSPRQSGIGSGCDKATLMLLALSGLFRLVAQLLDVNVIGALLLSVDVFALARLAGLAHRQRAVSPLWLALLFCFCLPVEPMLQRVLGYGLQQISASVACAMLSPFDVACEGVRLKIDGVDVLVDLPCSGAELLSVIGMLFAGISAVRPPRLRRLPVAVGACLIVALLGNGLRIAVLALGIVHREALGVDVMAPLPHSLIGAVIVALAALALLRVNKALASPPASLARHPGSVERRLALSSPAFASLFACAFVGFAAVVGSIQPRPVDSSSSLIPPDIPLVAAGFLARDEALTPLEKRYFEQYGGGARRAAYGPYGLLLVRTASPLRHLHDPNKCFTAMGFAVDRVGTDFERMATIYAVRSPAGPRYEVHVTYISDAGRVATSIAEVVWRWLEAPEVRWTMVQRVVPVTVQNDGVHEWHAAINRAFNLNRA